MQAAQAAVPYLQNLAAMKKDYAPAAGDRQDQKNSFSDTLKQGMSKGTESSADSAASKKPVQPQKETAQETQQGPQAEEVIVPIVAGLIQNPYIPQEMTSETAVPIIDLTAETPVIPVQQQTAAMPETMETAEIAPDKNDASELLPKQAAAVELQAAGSQQRTQTGPQQQTDATAENTVQASSAGEERVTVQSGQTGQNAAQQGQGQTDAETADAKTSELAQTTDRQDTGVSRQSAFEVPRTADRASVDMSNTRNGIQNMARTMADHMAAGKNEFEIWLEPANLGKMAIKVAYEGGRAMVSIMCTNEKTMELISQNAKQLGNILQQHTGDDTVVVIDHPESDYLQQKMDQQQQNGQQQEEQDGKNKNDEQQDPDHESFLQQLRLGLM